MPPAVSMSHSTPGAAAGACRWLAMQAKLSRVGICLPGVACGSHTPVEVVWGRAGGPAAARAMATSPGSRQATGKPLQGWPGPHHPQAPSPPRPLSELASAAGASGPSVPGSSSCVTVEGPGGCAHEGGAPAG